MTFQPVLLVQSSNNGMCKKIYDSVKINNSKRNSYDLIIKLFPVFRIQSMEPFPDKQKLLMTENY